MVGAVQIQTNDDVLQAGVHRGVYRAQRLGKDGTGTPVQEPVGLGIAFDGHRADYPIGACLEHFDAHFGGQGSHAEGR